MGFAGYVAASAVIGLAWSNAATEGGNNDVILTDDPYPGGNR
jgi:hypothetical protein